MMKKKVIFGVLFFLLFGSLCHATIYVDADAPAGGTGTYEDPFDKIQDAIDAAYDQDVIIIRPGIYTGVGNFELDPGGKSVTIQSIDPNDMDVIESTVIDPNQAGRGFYFHTGEDENCVIQGLTVRNAKTGGKGAGIYCYYSHPTILNCIIRDCFAGTHGGGFFCQNSSPEITGCVISGNVSANDGGAIEWWYGNAKLKQCIIFNNQASGAGGGIDFYGSGSAIVENCTFAANASARGGAVYCWNSTCTVTNSIFRGSTADDSGPEIGIYNGNVTVSYSNIEGGADAIAIISNGLNWGDGNIDIEPDFAIFDQSGNPSEWDFRLQSEYGRWNNELNTWVADNVTSPCIDAGDPNSYLGREVWPNGKQINMGAYGGTVEASKNGNIADFDISGSVDGLDLSELAGCWLDDDGGIVNLDLVDGVNCGDFAVFAENWLWQRE